MKLIKLLVFCSFTIFFNSCWFDTIKGKGEPEKFQRNLNDYSTIILQAPADVYIIQGSEYSLTIETNPNIASLITTEVNNQVLTIGSEENINTKKLDIFITMPYVEKLEIRGSGDILCKNEISSKKLVLAIEGSGNITMNKIVTREITCSIGGSGDIKLITGKAKEANLRIDGSGNIEADHIDCEDVNADINGSGDILCYAEDNLKVDINGSGNLKYKGQPKSKVNINGSGQVTSF